jgi:LmbE family N-acetylglucosaminyl deacetylase
MSSESEKQTISFSFRMGQRLTTLLLALLLLISQGVAASVAASAPLIKDEAEDAALYQALLDLTNPWTVMCVAAHPDDEDGATLTVLRRKEGAHTVTVFSTYGEGGQNATGPELYEELGVIRARETIEAASLQGSEPHFLGLRDFGFSKSAEEAFRIWGRNEALKRLVLKIRTLRPDVIITNHDTTSGHGHHQATGRLLLEAFTAAADAKQFPEQLQGEVKVWQAQRLFVRAGAEGGTSGRTPVDEARRDNAIVTIDPNERDTVRGSTYAEQALSALRRHASQGPWPERLPANGAPLRRYKLVQSSKQAAPLPPNARSVLEGLRLPGQQAAPASPLAMDAMLALYLKSGRSRESVLQPLLTTRKSLAVASLHPIYDLPRLQLMFKRLDRALALASRVKVRLRARDDILIPGIPAPFSLHLTNGGDLPLTVRSRTSRTDKTVAQNSPATPDQVAPGKDLTYTYAYFVRDDTPLSVPREEHLYDGHLFGLSFSEELEVEIDGARFTVGDETQVDVAPPVEIKRITPSPLVLTPTTIRKPTTFTLTLVNHQSTPFNGKLVAGNSQNRVGTSEAFSLAPHETKDVGVTFSLPLTGDTKRGQTKPVHDSVPFIIMDASLKRAITKRTVRDIYADARVAPNLRVGYVRSVDYTLRDALAALGVLAKELTVEDVRAANLNDYDTIIIDNRGYQAHPELIQSNARLLDFVSAGGTLIVFYHRTNEWNPDAEKKRPQLAPYPITLGSSRVTDENAPMSFLLPRHPLLNSPNRITTSDFNNWLQERGLYYPQEWDAHYSALLSMNDAGEAPLSGGLLAAEYGRGQYIYTSMVWYRQLREGLSGAYRVFANMLSFGHETKRPAR